MYAVIIYNLCLLWCRVIKFRENIVNSPLISVVIATKNESKNIENCLKSILMQTYRNYEVIVIDNFSSDSTIDIAKQYTDKVFQIGPERSKQRNYGLFEIANGDFGFYVDADMILSPNLLKHFVDNISDGVTGYFVEEVVLGKSLFNRIRRFERFFYNSTPIDAVRIFPLFHFKSVGGFDEKIFTLGSGEDWDLDIKLSSIGDLYLIPKKVSNNYQLQKFFKEFSIISENLPNKYQSFDAVIFHNEINLRFLSYLKKKRYYAKGFDAYINKWGENNPHVKKQFSFNYRYFNVFVENGKWKMALLRPHFILLIIFYKFLVGLIYLESRIMNLYSKNDKIN